MALLATASSSFAQGQFYFSNRDLTAGVDARFVACYGGSGGLTGPDWQITLSGGPRGGALVPLEPSSTTFRSGAAAGYVVPVTVTVPGVAPGAAADVLVKVSGPMGTFENKFTVPSLGGELIVPPTLPMGSLEISLSWVTCPEPSTLLLGALGSISLIGGGIRRLTRELGRKERKEQKKGGVMGG